MLFRRDKINIDMFLLLSSSIIIIVIIIIIIMFYYVWKESPYCKSEVQISVRTIWSGHFCLFIFTTVCIDPITGQWKACSPCAIRWIIWHFAAYLIKAFSHVAIKFCSACDTSHKKDLFYWLVKKSQHFYFFRVKMAASYTKINR